MFKSCNGHINRNVEVSCGFLLSANEFIIYSYRFSRGNPTLKVDFRWPQFFSEAIFTSSIKMRQQHLQLFRFEAQMTDTNEPADRYTLMEKALNIYRYRKVC